MIKRGPRKLRLVHPLRKERRKDKRTFLRKQHLPQGLANNRSWHQVRELVKET